MLSEATSTSPESGSKPRATMGNARLARGAALGEEAVLPDSGWAGENDALGGSEIQVLREHSVDLIHSPQ